jgi:broad specificity polyphosphatase/5'/3'-nucleotidase SurE
MEMIDTETDVETAPKKKRISRTMQWARAHKFMIYEVTDPELRSQLCYYRNKEKREKEQQEQTQDQDMSYEETDA